VRYLGLSVSADEKLARYLLDQAAAHGTGEGKLRVTLALTHEEIAEMIGASRETVTRLLTSFKRKRLVEFRGATLTIKDRAGLTKFLSG
jgi:CRP/FNR family cyclic AMP-dependent transcriptional regulator